MIDLNRLNIFLHAAETLSFSEAAAQLHLSQPTVSKHIRDLEQDLGVVLFDRSSSKPRLTDAGRMLVPWASKLLHDSMELRGMIGALQDEPAGQLRIACSTTAGKYVLPQLAARFRDQYPNVRISILSCMQEQIAVRLVKEEADLGVVSMEAGALGLECQHFITDHIILIVAAGHPWSFREAVEPSELLAEPILLREPTSGTRRVMLSEMARHDITLEDLNVGLELGSGEGIVAAVIAGVGVAFVSRLAAACAMVQGCIVEVPVTGMDLRRKICMTRRSIGPSSRPAEAFWSFIHDSSNRELLNLADM